MTQTFPRVDGELHVEGVAVRRIAEQVGTPVFIYSATALCDSYDALDAAFGETPHILCYSIKSNMNLAVVRTLVAQGAGIDVTSGGELFRALRAGASPDKIVYSGVGKTDQENLPSNLTGDRYHTDGYRGVAILEREDGPARYLGWAENVEEIPNPAE